MSFLNEFEGRIGSIFGEAPQGYTEPFSFKKLAKRAAREMENETFEIDGVDTAPALYTVLVSSSDDSLMRPLYQKITFETAAYVAAEAQKKGYAFVGEPLVRFMVDPTLKSGKFAVFAENVDARTLADLRAEEMAFLGANSSMGGAAKRPRAQARPGAAPMPEVAQPAPKPQAPAPVAEPALAPQASAAPASAQAPNGAANVAAGMAAADAFSERPVSSVPVGDLSPVGFADAGLDVIPSSYDYADAAPMPVASSTSSTPMPVAAAPLVDPLAAHAAIPVPMTQRRPAASPLVDLRRGVGSAAAANVAAGVAAGSSAGVAASVAAQAGAAAEVAAAASDPFSNPDPYGVGLGGPQMPAAPAATCLLIDRQTGRTFTGSAPSTIIGRERSQAGIVLRDPNVSRRHAELRFDGREWHIVDLRSTNGTLVNDVDVDECVLRDGDLLTLGLVNLEFRENNQ